MKFKKLPALLLCFSASFSLFSQTTSNIQQSLSINNDGAAPNASAILDVKATDKGMLVPRMTSAQRTAITTPATGLLAFDTNTGSFWFYDGTIWVDLASPKILADNDGDTKIQVEKTADEDVIHFDISGNEYFTLTNKGLGINKTNPQWPLEVLTNTTYVYGITPLIKISDNFKAWHVGLGSEGYRFSIASEDYTERFTIHQPSGNVSIGESIPSHKLVVTSEDAKTLRLIGPSPPLGYGARLNFGDGDFTYIDEPEDDIMQIQAARIGIGRLAITNKLEVEGTASKLTAGDWLANSDARLKKNILPLNSQLMLQSLLALQGVTYEWNDDKTGSKRPEGVQYGFTAQNIQAVFPTLVEEDKLGYLQTAYGTYDAMTVEAIRALYEKIEEQQAEIDRLKKVEAQLSKITAALAGAGISVDK